MIEVSKGLYLSVLRLLIRAGRGGYRRAQILSTRWVQPYFPALHGWCFVSFKPVARKLYFGLIRRAKGADGLAHRLPYRALPAAAFQPKVSVIVPNYRHAAFLRQRLDSIYTQTYRNFEVILLDDASGDGSEAIFQDYLQRFPDITSVHLNQQNSGSAFHQWAKGIALASGDLVWIAESDDYCDDTFLDTLIPAFRNEGVMLSYARSSFVGREGEERWTIEAYLAELSVDTWRKPFVRSAHHLVNSAWGQLNIVPNVSSAVFRHPGAMPLLDEPSWRNMRICGDWIFYLHLIRGGLVAYSPDTTNYYRLHDGNTSTATYGRDAYYIEHEQVAVTLASLFRLAASVLQAQRDTVFRHWQRHRADEGEAAFKRCYDLARVAAQAAPRKANVVMVGLALVAGGGETFPIKLANLMRKAGYAVTFFNCAYHPSEPGVRAMLEPGVPLIELEALDRLPALLEELGAEIVHSHHAWVDATICSMPVHEQGTRHVVTMHGMYEMLAKPEFDNLAALIEPRVSRFVYIAEKNLAPFDRSRVGADRFVKIGNAMQPAAFAPLQRAAFGLPEDAFVLCLVSRAIAEKGWREAIDATTRARAACGRDIRLALVGDGPELEALSREGVPEYVHLLGFQGNVMGCFAMADLGLLPSRFGGESAPLVLIECLYAGRPFLASNVGEIANMLDSDAGPAGAVFDLQQGAIPVACLADLIARYASDEAFYQQHVACIPAALPKFEPARMVDGYDGVYRAATADLA